MQQMKVLLVMICASTCLFGCIAPGGEPPFPTATASLREEVTRPKPTEVTMISLLLPVLRRPLLWNSGSVSGGRSDASV